MNDSVILIQTDEDIIYGPFKDEAEAIECFHKCQGEQKGWKIIASLPQEIMLEVES